MVMCLQDVAKIIKMNKPNMVQRDEGTVGVFYNWIFLVEEKEAFGRNACHVLFYILIVSLGVVIITVVVVLLWHFRSPETGTGKISYWTISEHRNSVEVAIPV